MELCEGGALLERIESNKYSEAYIAKLLRSILRFISQCHAKGIIYRQAAQHACATNVHVNLPNSTTCKTAKAKTCSWLRRLLPISAPATLPAFFDLSRHKSGHNATAASRVSSHTIDLSAPGMSSLTTSSSSHMKRSLHSRPRTLDSAYATGQTRPSSHQDQVCLMEVAMQPGCDGPSWWRFTLPVLGLGSRNRFNKQLPMLFTVMDMHGQTRRRER